MYKQATLSAALPKWDLETLNNYLHLLSDHMFCAAGKYFDLFI